MNVAAPSPELAKLSHTLEAHPQRVPPLAARLGGRRARRRSSPRPHRPATRACATRSAARSTPTRRRAAAAGLEAYTLSANERKAAPALDSAMWGVLTALDRGEAVKPAVNRARTQFGIAQQQLGEFKISRGTVVTDAAILVFREGLEAVLILAAITASLTGARAQMRRPVLIGGLAGIGATIVTWALVQLLVSELGTGGLRLEAITGVLAIVVLLVVTNWFFHRVYWSQWISRFNRRRKTLEKLGLASGGLVILGLTSVYREGFETVLFVQNLQVSAGTARGRARLGDRPRGHARASAGSPSPPQRKLPYQKMLIATGVMIAVVLAVMTGATAHVLQGLGWLPSTPTAFDVPLWASRWLGIYRAPGRGSPASSARCSSCSAPTSSRARCRSAGCGAAAPCPPKPPQTRLVKVPEVFRGRGSRAGPGPGGGWSGPRVQPARS